MAHWTLLHMASPLNTSGGNGLIRELTYASSRRLTFSADDVATLTFDMPGGQPQTAQISPLIDDVLVFRDDEVVQRFRVVSRAVSKDSGVTSVSFSAVSYRALLDARIIHSFGAMPTDPLVLDPNVGHRTWPDATYVRTPDRLVDADREQTLIAWTLINDAQSRPSGSLGITRGPLPVVTTSRVLVGETVDFQPLYYYDAGKPVSEAINELSQLDQGFEWDIVPDPAAPYTALKAMFWTVGDGGRNQHTVRSDLLLNDGGTLASWSHVTTPDAYGNVARFTGSTDVTDNVRAAPVSDVAVWVPATENPTGTPDEGRWERNVNNGDWTTTDAVTAAAPKAFSDIHDYIPELACQLRRGRWTGPSQLWLGDICRIIITEQATGSDDYLVYVDDDVRVVEINVDVDDQGAEDVSLSLNRPAFSTRKDAQRVSRRLSQLERR